MVVLQIDFDRIVTVPTECQPVVPRYGQRKSPIEIAAKRMKPETWNVQVLWSARSIKRIQPLDNPSDKPCIQTLRLATFPIPFQGVGAERADHICKVPPYRQM